MDWRSSMAALIPGLEGAVLQHLNSVASPRTAPQVHHAARTGSLSGIRLALERLADQGLVISQHIGNAIVYSLNTDHLAYPAVAAALARYRPYGELRERLATLIRAHASLLERHEPTVAIYGSVARGDATTASDLDLVLVLDARAPAEAADELEAALREEPQQWTGNSVHLLRCTRAWLQDARARQDPLLASWAAEADTVYGPPLGELLAAVA